MSLKPDTKIHQEKSNLSEMWSGVSRADFNLWKRQNPEGKVSEYKSWRLENPDATLPTLPKENKVPASISRKIPAKFKSQELKNFERIAELNSGEGLWNAYVRVFGRWKWLGAVDSCSREEIAEAFGGGRFKVVRVDPNTDREMVGDGACVIIDIHEGQYPPKVAPLPQTVRALAFEQEDDEVRFTAEDLKEAETKAAKDSELKNTIAALQAKAFAVDTPKEDRLDMLQKLVELQKALMPAPAIGETKSITDTISGVAAAVTAAFGAWQEIKKLLPAPVAENSSGGGIVERVFGTLAEKVGAKMIESQLAPAQETPGPENKKPTNEEKKMFDSMMDELAMEIAKQQEIEANTKADTVAPMVTWILEQKGFAWDVLRMQARANDPDEVVTYIGSKRSTLIDSDFKKSWVKNVVEVLKAPEAIGK